VGAAISACEEWLEDHDPEVDEWTDVKQFKDDLEDIQASVESCEFPGMMGS
jgi:hypothetical protein